jgi:hypothetical protein
MAIRTLNTEAFKIWTSDRGIGRDPNHPDSEHLIFTAGGVSGNLACPGEAARVPQFLGALLSAVRPNDRYWVYPARGIWSLGREAESLPQSRIWTAAVKAFGVPAGLRGAVGFNSTDWNELLAMLFVQITIGPSVVIDTSVIPDNGSAVLHFEQAGAVSVAFREQPRLDAVVAEMERAGYSSPAEVPA